MQSITAARRRLSTRLADARAAARQRAEARRALTDATAALTAATAAQARVQATAAQCQQLAHAQVAALVSRCLAAVFNDPYTFKIEFLAQRGKTEARLLFERNGHQYRAADVGGGVVDVAAFALRLAALLLGRPRRRKLLVVDEPFRFVSADRRPRVREMLGVLATELDVQIIMVTHIAELRCGRLIRLGGMSEEGQKSSPPAI